MKKKELKNFAKKFAQYEQIIQTSTDKEEVYQAEKEIMRLSNLIESSEDMIAIDELVMEILEKNS